MRLLYCKAEGKKSGQNYKPPLLEKFRKANNHQGKGGKLCAKIGKYRLKLGHYLD
ncbi:hypothetical protein FQZ97_978550 [compost metagenome]